MTATWRTCLPPRRRRGLTLVEVIAALVILGTVLVGLVMARSRHAHQVATSRQRMAAVRATDELIASWWTSQAGVPEEATGSVPGSEGMAWQTRPVRNVEVESVGGRVVRVEVMPAASRGLADRAPAEPLVTVDLVLPAKPAPAEAPR